LGWCLFKIGLLGGKPGSIRIFPPSGGVDLSCITESWQNFCSTQKKVAGGKETVLANSIQKRSGFDLITNYEYSKNLVGSPLLWFARER
jgi:hypothetical protein